MVLLLVLAYPQKHFLVDINTMYFNNSVKAKNVKSLFIYYSFLFLRSDFGGLSDQKNNAKQIGIIISKAATMDIV